MRFGKRSANSFFEGLSAVSCSVLVLFFLCLSAKAEWAPLGSGFDKTVKCFAFDGTGNLYAGGQFTSTGDVPVDRLAVWDGTNWSAFGDGLKAIVNTICLTEDGIYAGGNFFEDAGAPANYVARWDGTQWTPLGEGTDGPVHTLVFRDGNLYVGGNFNSAGGLDTHGVARWDGENWHSIGNLGGRDAPVNVMVFDDSGNLCAGGNFFSIDGPNHVAMWDGSNWNELGSGGMNDSVYALVPRNGKLYAGGLFNSAGGVAAPGIAEWNGTSWSPLGSGVNSGVDVRAITFDASGNLYAGGGFQVAGGTVVNCIAKWDGTAWSALGEGTNGSVYALAFRGANLYAGGDFWEAGGNVANAVAKWETGPTGELTLTASPAEGGSTVPVAGTPQIIPLNTPFMITAVPSPEYRFVKWTGSDPNASFEDEYAANTQVTITGNVTATALFQKDVQATLVTYGTVYDLVIADIVWPSEEETLKNFASKPKVYAAYEISNKEKKASLGIVTKIAKGKPVDAVECEWLAKIALLDKAIWSANKTKTTAQILTENKPIPLACELFVSGQDENKTKVKDVDTQLELTVVPPEITGFRNAEGQSTDSLILGEEPQSLTVVGTYFGKSTPSVWLEYMTEMGDIKKIKLKIDKSFPLKYVDAKGKPSCMDVATGTSEFSVIVPALGKMPKDWQPGTVGVVIDNKICRASRDLALNP